MTMDLQVKRGRIDRVELSYVEAGAGQPVVFVHGYLGDFRGWRSQIAFFSNSYHTVAYSLRYNYPRRGPGEESDQAQLVHMHDLSSLLEKLNLKPAHIVASSYGCAVALLLALRHPDLVRSLVLGEPGILSWLQDLPEGIPLLNEFRTKFAEPAKKKAREGAIDEAMRLTIDGAIGPGIYDKLPEASRRSLMDNAHLIPSFNYSDSFARSDADKVTTPTLLLTGDRSPRMYHLIADELARHLPDIERGMIPGAAHMLHSFNPSDYNEAVLRFLSKH